MGVHGSNGPLTLGRKPSGPLDTQGRGMGGPAVEKVVLLADSGWSATPGSHV